MCDVSQLFCVEDRDGLQKYGYYVGRGHGVGNYEGVGKQEGGRESSVGVIMVAGDIILWVYLILLYC